MTTEKATFQTEDGTRLFSHSWAPPTKDIKAVCFLAHGLGEHCLCYEDIGQLLSSRGILVKAHDHRGHGQSEGNRGLIKSLDVLVHDVLHHVNQLRQQHPDVPVFLLGHSMGGTISVKCILLQPDWFRGTVLIGPALKPAPETASPILVTSLRLVNFFFPNLTVARINPAFISRNTETVKKYEEDPLILHDGVKAGTAKTFLDAVKEIEQRMSDVKSPMLILHGTQDKLANVEGSQMLFERSTSKDKTIKIFEDAYHQLHHELKDVKDATLTLTVDWIVQRI